MTSGAPAPRERLVAAAEARFRRFGYKRTTVEDITAAAGTGKGSLYLHFDSKEAVYLAVVEASLERFVETATATLRARGSVARRLSALVEATAQHYGHDELLAASLLGETHLVDGRVAALAAEIQRTRIRGLLADIIAEGRRDKSVRSGLDPEVTAAVLFEMGWGVVRAGLEDVTGVPLETALATLNGIVGRGIQTPRRR
ncbi:MAG: TetR/AcrR family transcriptional regulator [Acidimicrobiia bacterium]